MHAVSTLLRKGLEVHLCIVETSGGANGVLVQLLRLLARTAAAKGATDNSRYGYSRTSTRSFYTHHLTEISTAVQVADAEHIANAAAHEAFALSHGLY